MAGLHEELVMGLAAGSGMNPRQIAEPSIALLWTAAAAGN
jgi:hypothetical protein